MVDISKTDEILAWLHDSKFLTSLNLRDGYYHIKCSPKTRYDSSFTTIFGNMVISILDLASHRDVPETICIIGLVSYYRKSVASCYDMVKHFTECTKKHDFQLESIMLTKLGHY